MAELVGLARLDLGAQFVRGQAFLVGERVRYGFTRAGDVPVELTVSDGTGLVCGTASVTATASNG